MDPARALLKAAARLRAEADRLEILADRLDAQPAPQPPGRLVELRVAAERLGIRPDTLRKMCRSMPDLGIREGHRWMVDVEVLKRHRPQSRESRF